MGFTEQERAEINRLCDEYLREQETGEAPVVINDDAITRLLGEVGS